jgi:hypothetical protein
MANQIGDGRAVVTTAGTAVPISSKSVFAYGVAVTALSTNTGVICVGSTTVVAAAGTRRGSPLNAGDSVLIDIDDISRVYIDATVSGEGVSYTYTTPFYGQ